MIDILDVFSKDFTSAADPQQFHMHTLNSLCDVSHSSFLR